MTKSEGNQGIESRIEFAAFEKVSKFLPQDNVLSADHTLRPEQIAAIEQTSAYYYRCLSNPNLQPTFLWNAKPRFGKTFAAYSFAARIHAQKILIVTNRPAVADSWYTDFQKFGFQEPIEDSNSRKQEFRWIFTSSEAARRRLGQPRNIYTRQEQLLNPKLLHQNFIHFISLQDIKSRDLSGFKQKNSWIFDYGRKTQNAGWDLVIIDESHEGVNTKQAFEVFDNIKSKFTLHLSGTPFKALANHQFTEEQIYNWSYIDEQHRKQECASDPQNPYATLPKVNLVTYQLSRILETYHDTLTENDYIDGLSELFRVGKRDGKDYFAHEKEIRQFIKNLSNPEKSYPFSHRTSRAQLRHTLWLLPGVKACEQLKRVLLNDPYFKSHYAPEDIIMAAGRGDSDRISSTVLNEVQKRARDLTDSRTITLSCGQLTTGVTVPAWSAILMLSNCKSPSLYVQSIFRAQNPCQTSEGLMKTNCFVFDFTPEQSLSIMARIANAKSEVNNAKTNALQIEQLLNHLPILAEDENGRIRQLDAEEVINIPLQFASHEILTRKFMSNRLFQNINNIFGCPLEIRNIINKINIDGKTSDTLKVSARPRIWLDKQKVIHINEDIIIPTRDGFLSDLEYVELGTKDAEEISSILNLAIRQARDAGYSTEAIRLIKTALTRKLPKLVVQLPKPDAELAYKKESPDSPPASKEKTEEEKTRAHLRAFAKSIPTLLMAYGTSDTRLSNFDSLVPDEVFENITGITKNDFRKLRDGVDPDRASGFFNEAVFNAAIQQFCQKRTELAEYYCNPSEEDIFKYVSPQAANQIFTPRFIVKNSINQLIAQDSNIFKSTTNTFLDPYMKSGIYLAEIAKQIFRHTRDQYKNDFDCIKHILEHQIFGLAPTPILHIISQNNLFGFDHDHQISRKNFQEVDVTEVIKNQQLAALVNQLFGKGGEEMKFTAVVGNPPYIENNSKTNSQAQGSSSWIYQHFQNNTEPISRLTCLVYPFGGWFDSPQRLGGFGKKILGDGHTVSIDAYESTSDYRAWFRNDRKPQPVFGDEANLSAGVAIVLRDLQNYHGSFWYANRMYTDERTTVKAAPYDFLPPNPAFHKISQKLYGQKLCKRIQKNIFGIESNFVETHPHQVSTNPADWKHPIQLLANDKSGSAGRTKNYWIECTNIPKGAEYLDLYKVVIPSAYPKKTFVASQPSIANIKSRLQELTEVLPQGSAFGRSRLALFMSNSEQECQNFLKYTQTNFFAALLLQEPNRRSSFGDIIPDQDFSTRSDINWNGSLAEIDQQLFQKYSLTKAEREFLGI